MKKPDVSVIISTYNQPQWLQKVLWSYHKQLYKNFEVVIADDGSDEKTKNCILKLQKEVDFPIHHIWHPDNGFQKTVILNKAIKASNGQYLIFTDGDCIAKNDFITTHILNRKKGCFLSGGYFKLPLKISEKINKHSVESQQCFDLKWLKNNGLKSSLKNSKLIKNQTLKKILNKLSPTTASWNGHNSSAWKDDILKVNGFDERMQYGGEDREFGERLINLGLKPKRIRYTAICLHLYHKRGYVKPEMIEKNKKIRAETKKNKTTVTSYGIIKTL